MKFLISFAVLILLVGTLEAHNKIKEKEQWREKKLKHHIAVQKEKSGNVNGFQDNYYPKRKTHKMKHYFGKKMHKKSKIGRKVWKLKKSQKAMDWLSLSSDAKCEMKCKPEEVCISSQMMPKPMCIHKKDLKKSMKFLHKFHKKDIKAWKKQQKKAHKVDRMAKKEEKFGRAEEYDFQDLKDMKMKKLGKGHRFEKKHKKFGKEYYFGKKYEKLGKKHHFGKKYEKLSKEHQFDKKLEKHGKEHHFEKKLEKHGKEHHFDKKDTKLGKEHHFDTKFEKKEKMHHHIPRPKKHARPVCTHSEFGQMKSRMTAWFHLLHGQDHKARMAHGGSLSKFYKHISVKKELRQVNGEQCNCMKSAIWQFHQMDWDKDGQLSDKEMSFLEQNSLEPCMRPLLESCDSDHNKMINGDEWCCCFNDNVLPPCDKAVKELRKAGNPVTFLPACDKEGYFLMEQCKGEGEEKVCWCVDQSGNEFLHTAKQGRAHCHKVEKLAYKKKIIRE